MSEAVAWTCPTCNHAAIVRGNDYTYSEHTLKPRNKHGFMGIRCFYVRCPNPVCGSYELKVWHVPVDYNDHGPDNYGQPISEWRFFPRSAAKIYADYVPAPVREDYEEASLITTLSPKASATLARRALQGIIRDFWKVKAGRLIDEIKAIKDKCDPLTWEAIEAVRKVGNIGAHMEADIDLIVNVDPDEAKLLLELIETLLDDWYVTRYERQRRLNAVAALAGKRDEAKGLKPPPGPHV